MTASASLGTDHISAAIAAVRAFDAAPGGETLVAAHTALEQLEETLAALAPSARTVALRRFALATSRYREAWLLTGSFLARVDADRAFWGGILARIGDGTIRGADAHALFWQAITATFAQPERHDGAGYAARARAYRRLLADAQAQVAPLPLPPVGARAAKRRVAVLANQFVGYTHAPTRDALDIAARLQYDLGLEVLLVNVADMPAQFTHPIYRFAVSCDAPGLERVRGLAVEGRGTVPFLQAEHPPGSAAKYGSLRLVLAAFAPDVVLAVGDTCVAADLMRDRAPVVTLPCNAALPVCASDLHVLPREATAADLRLHAQAGFAREQLLEIPYTYVPPAEMPPLERATLGIGADDAVLAVVGNRLDTELTPEVVALLDAVLVGDPAVRLVVVGAWERLGALQGERPHWAARVHGLGFRNDLPAILAMCDAYWNPPRLGGGTAAAWSMALGRPVLTPPGGDVAFAAGESALRWSTPEELQALVRRLREDQAWRAAVREAARARFAAISDRAAMLRTLLERVGLDDV